MPARTLSDFFGVSQSMATTSSGDRQADDEDGHDVFFLEADGDQLVGLFVLAAGLLEFLLTFQRGSPADEAFGVLGTVFLVLAIGDADKQHRRDDDHQQRSANDG